eukprot:TRINITY_DN1624_c0_g1_i2.p1 TRINITY_DN1624_c0_g1~~TRINITY_DN1624_c0_g1_i2.p1  ORF type:complete len:156 (-),score=26.17 TRINITY_DN1624_c0_g1_i2:86-553(-)
MIPEKGQAFCSLFPRCDDHHTEEICETRLRSMSCEKFQRGEGNLIIQSPGIWDPKRVSSSQSVDEFCTVNEIIYKPAKGSQELCAPPVDSSESDEESPECSFDQSEYIIPSSLDHEEIPVEGKTFRALWKRGIFRTEWRSGVVYPGSKPRLFSFD